jgi:hypothetical protein
VLRDFTVNSSKALSISSIRSTVVLLTLTYRDRLLIAANSLDKQEQLQVPGPFHQICPKVRDYFLRQWPTKIKMIT